MVNTIFWYPQIGFGLTVQHLMLFFLSTFANKKRCQNHFAKYIYCKPFALVRLFYLSLPLVLLEGFCSSEHVTYYITMFSHVFVAHMYCKEQNPWKLSDRIVRQEHELSLDFFEFETWFPGLSHWNIVYPLSPVCQRRATLVGHCWELFDWFCSLHNVQYVHVM